MNNKTKNILLSAFIIVVTIGVFLLVNHKILDTVMCWYTLAIIVLSEVLLSVSWITFNGMPQKFAIVTVCTVQTLANIAVSALFLILFRESYIGYSVYSILSFAIVIVLGFFLYNASKATSNTETAKDFFLKCRMVINSAASSSNGEAYRDQLKKLEENIRFCNDGILLDSDEKIYEVICDLKAQLEIGGDNIPEIIANINSLIQQHDFTVKTSKR